MANAAAKKSAAAKSATANVYQPILIGSNVLYILLLVVSNQYWTPWTIAGIVVAWGLQIFAYIGILDHAKNNTANRQKDLVGGVHLDLLGLTILIQFGSALHSPKWFYLLWIVPLWGGWMLYTNFFGGNKKGTANSPAAMSETTMAAVSGDKDKRDKRAQKRRQKWS